MKNKQRYYVSIVGSYPGATDFSVYTESDSAENAAASVAADYDVRYPENAPHFTTAEIDEKPPNLVLCGASDYAH